MRVRRVLAAATGCALVSLALLASSAQAGLPKIKGASAYYFCDVTACPEPTVSLVVYNKAKTWEFYDDPEKLGGPVVKYPKNKLTYFYYEPGETDGECYLSALKVKGGYEDGGFYCNHGSGYYLVEEWHAYK